MKFTLHRKPDSKAQKIPFLLCRSPVSQTREALVLRAEEGCILLARDSLSTREIVKVIAFLDEIVTSMAEQLAKKSDEMASLQEEDDPLNAFDEDEIDTLEDFVSTWRASGASLLWRMAEMNEAYLYPYSAEYARQRGRRVSMAGQLPEQHGLQGCYSESRLAALRRCPSGRRLSGQSYPGVRL